MRSSDDMDSMFDRLIDLSDQQKATIKERYRFLMAEYRRRLWMYALMFYMLRITMTVGSLTVPALLSLSVAPAQADFLKWLTWGISLAVTTANGLITLFKIDKRFFLLRSVAERLRTETWQYLSLAGRYSGHYGGHKPTHANQYVYYTSQVERLRMRHIEEEFVRQADMGDTPKQQTATTATTTTMKDVQIPSPPEQAGSSAPAIRRRESVLSPPMRRESTSTVGSSDDAIVHITAATAAMSMSGRSGPLSQTGTQGQSLLLQTSEMSDLTSESGRASVQSGSLQSGPDGARDT